jgi:hypothetical protein
MNNNNLKQAAYIAVGSLFALLLLAIYYYKERVIFMDASYILFQIINDGQHAIQENRFGSFITHLVPFLFGKFNMPIKTIIIGYTLSFNLFYLAIISIMVFKLREYALAILMSFYYLLMVSDTFYWSNNEVHQGIAWMFLTMALLQYGANYKTNSFMQVAILFMLGFLAISSHLLVTMPFAFLFFYILFDKNQNHFTLKEKIILPLGLLGLIFLKYRLSLIQNYDGQKLLLIDKLSLNDISYYINQEFGLHFIKSCTKEYWLTSLLFLIGLISLIRTKKWGLCFLTVMGCFSYYTFMCITFSNTGTYEKFHIESEWMGLGIIAATPFVFEFLNLTNKRIAVYALIIISIIRISYIIEASDKFKLRLQTSENIMDAMKRKGITKLAINENLELEHNYMLDWSLEEESLLLSCLNNEKPLSTFFILKKDAIPDSILKSTSIYIGCFHNYKFSEINKNYFKLDSTTCYSVLDYQHLMK